MSARVVLRIDELVLHGFPPEQRWEIADAVQAELGRLLADRGLSPGAGYADRVDGGSFLASARGPASVGKQIAGAVHGALDGRGR